MHSNEQTLRRTYDAFLQGDMAPLFSMLRDDVQWHAGGTSPVSGTYTGKAEVGQFFEKMMALYGGTLQLSVVDVMASDGHGVVLTEERATHDHHELRFNSVHTFRFVDGKVAAFDAYEDDQYHAYWQARVAAV